MSQQNTFGPAPVDTRARITALDAARGFALLGIFCVNIQTFAEPFGRLIDPTPPEGLGEMLAFYFVRIFCEGKFYPLFSAMFGIGLILQMERVRAAGGRFGSLYARRLAVLAFMGLAHALLLWYGDILFYYSIAGAILLLCSRLSARALLWTGVALVSLATLLSMGFVAISLPDTAPNEMTTEAAPAGPAHDETAFFEPGALADAGPEAAKSEFDHEFYRTPFGRLIKGFQTETVSDPQDPVWVQNELEAYRHGPYLQLFLFRAMTWVMFAFVMVFSFGWHILGMFFIGAGLMKKGFFEDPAGAMPRRALAAGALIGLPLCAVSALLPALGISMKTMLASTAMQTVGGTLLALGYLGGVTLLARSGLLAGLTSSLARVGRMALTNYLMQSLIATTIFYYYGLGMFGETTRVQRLLLVFGVYALQHVFSWLWLSVFAMGPMEWAWRTLTYLRPQRLLRR